jgi:hypothetical protein
LNINELFPSEQDLVFCDDVMATIQGKIADLELKQREIIQLEELGNDLKSELAEYKETVERIGKRARESEKSLHDITRDISKLDQTKANLTAASRLLKRIHLSGINKILFSQRFKLHQRTIK